VRRLPLEDGSIEQIVAAVRTVAAGGWHSLRSRRARVRRSAATQREASPRAVAEGHANAEIAELLSLRVKTVESQLRRMFDRYDVTSGLPWCGWRNGRAGSRET